MPRKLILALLAFLFIGPAAAQVSTVQVPVLRPQAPPVNVQRMEPIVAQPGRGPAFDVANDPERARALIDKLRRDKRAMRDKLQTTLTELQNARTAIDEMTRLGGSLVRAQCVSATLSRTTSGVEENCAASGYNCAGSEGTCHRRCTESGQCAPGYLCDVGAGRCVTPPPPDNEEDDSWWPW